LFGSKVFAAFTGSKIERGKNFFSKNISAISKTNKVTRLENTANEQ
jgi:hypothetical protein